mmetsp:Transcript_13844/g.27196  ORF Transcript_13844/g.27196 Transcript_13844/m.27196 type:complete len:273 (+) Transcript_13844:628-1446(+)
MTAKLRNECSVDATTVAMNSPGIPGAQLWPNFSNARQYPSGMHTTMYAMKDVPMPTAWRPLPRIAPLKTSLSPSKNCWITTYTMHSDTSCCISPLCAGLPDDGGANNNDKCFRTGGVMKIPPTTAHCNRHIAIEDAMVLFTQSVLIAPRAAPTRTHTATEIPRWNMNMNPMTLLHIVLAMTCVSGFGSKPDSIVRISNVHHSVASIAYAGRETANNRLQSRVACFMENWIQQRCSSHLPFSRCQVYIVMTRARQQKLSDHPIAAPMQPKCNG